MTDAFIADLAANIAFNANTFDYSKTQKASLTLGNTSIGIVVAVVAVSRTGQTLSTN